MPLVLVLLLLEVLFLVSYGSVQEKNQVVLFCDNSLKMRKGGFCIFFLALRLVVDLLHFLLQA